MLVEYREKQRKIKEDELENYLRLIKERDNVNHQNFELSPTFQNPDDYKASYDRDGDKRKEHIKSSLGVMREIIPKRKNLLKDQKNNNSFVLPYKHAKYHDGQENYIELRIHYSKSKCASIKINEKSNPEKVARNF